MDGKVVTVRMGGYHVDTEGLAAAIKAVQAWRWRGNAPVPVRLEYVIWEGAAVTHFPFGEVMWTREDADALVAAHPAIGAVVCGLPVDPAARMPAKQA